MKVLLFLFFALLCMMFSCQPSEVLSYIKPQKERIKHYINRRLESFRVRQALMDSAYINPGIQYVQLRYTPSKADD